MKFHSRCSGPVCILDVTVIAHWLCDQGKLFFFIFKSSPVGKKMNDLITAAKKNANVRNWGRHIEYTGTDALDFRQAMSYVKRNSAYLGYRRGIGNGARELYICTEP